MVWAAMSSAGVGPLCFLKSTVNAASTRRFYSTSCFLLLTSFMEKLIHFPAELATCPHCQRYQTLVQWPWYYCAWLASQHARPEAHRVSMGYFQEKDEKQWIQQSRRAEDSIVSQQSHSPIASTLTGAGLCAKPRPSPECRNQHTLKKLELFSSENPFLIDL